MPLASDRNADDELFGNVAAHIWGCKYGVRRDRHIGGVRRRQPDVVLTREQQHRLPC
jgi:hypothetical protein